ncbi:MAG: flagellar assembly protein FliW [Peptostreptococcaceae bacterium]
MELIFKKGIPGFENLRNFEMNDLENSQPYKIIKSLEEKISFLSISPFEVDSSYEIDLSEDIIQELQIKSATDVLLLNIITIGQTLEDSTVNLKAPVVINIRNNNAKQFILQNDNYDTKHPLVRREKNVSNY